MVATNLNTADTCLIAEINASFIYQIEFDIVIKLKYVWWFVPCLHLKSGSRLPKKFVLSVSLKTHSKTAW